MCAFTSEHYTPEAVARAWDEEIARRIAAMESGDTEWIPAETAFARLNVIVLGTD